MAAGVGDARRQVSRSSSISISSRVLMSRLNRAKRRRALPTFLAVHHRVAQDSCLSHIHSASDVEPELGLARPALGEQSPELEDAGLRDPFVGIIDLLGRDAGELTQLLGLQTEPLGRIEQPQGSHGAAGIGRQHASSLAVARVPRYWRARPLTGAIRTPILFFGGSYG